MQPNEPQLDEKYCEICNKVMENCVSIQAFLDKCKACDLDTSEFQAQLDNQFSMAKKIKAQFFPHRN